MSSFVRTHPFREEFKQSNPLEKNFERIFCPHKLLGKTVPPCFLTYIRARPKPYIYVFLSKKTDRTCYMLYVKVIIIKSL